MKKTMLLATLLLAVGAYAQSPVPMPQPPVMNPSQPAPAAPAVTFGLSEVEGLKLQVLQLRRDLMNCQTTFNQVGLGTEIQQFIGDTLKAHGNPKDVIFDYKEFGFKVNPPVPAAKK